MKQKSKVLDYGLRYYVNDLYPINADLRGGQTFKKYFKYSFSTPIIILKYIAEKYQITFN